MRHLHAAVGQRQFEVAIAHRKHEVPADRPQDHLGGELPPLVGLPALAEATLRRLAMPLFVPTQDGTTRMQQNLG